ncbi:hypothetical protein CSB07_00120 [Candidatus Gracilibacteria bacterium]|nr:MAG: hypothetical protein CSB07_00120 [Candidatus Gracilibacteria bacterium]PIE85787.1 MAG: hypothetical protein CSA08_00155 [Candidatus Gracilibacteria bacterium]
MILIAFIGFFFLAISLIFIFSPKKKILSEEKRKFFIKNFGEIKKITDPKTKIIDYDKLYHNILKQIGYTGTFGDILKEKPKEITNLNKIWELHKLRNKLVHDFDKQKSLDKMAIEYENEIKKLFSIMR